MRKSTLNSRRWINLILVGSLILQTSSLALAQMNPAKNLVDQLDPNDPCAWWNSTNPSNCSGDTGQTNPSQGSANNDPWNWGGNDPTWNPNGPDNGAWGSDPSGYSNWGVDPSGTGISSGWGGGMYNPPPMGFVEGKMLSVLTANYTALVIQELNGHGLFDSESIDAVADEIIKKTSGYAAAWALTASMGIYVLDYMFSDKWRMSGGWYAGAMGAGLGVVMVGESWKVMQNQLTMLLELMELYGELSPDITQRSNEVALAMNMSLGGSALGTMVNRALRLEAVAPVPVPPVGGVITPTATSTLLGESGLASTKVAEKAAEEAMIKTGFLKAAIARFGATKVGEFMAAHSAVFKITASSLFAMATNYEITKYMGNNYKKLFRKNSKIHHHRVIEAFANNSDARQAVWLILTKYVFKSLDPNDAKLYAAIVSSQIPLLQNGRYNEADVLFEEYKKPTMTDPMKVSSQVPDPKKLAQTKTGKPVAGATPSPKIIVANDVFNEDSSSYDLPGTKPQATSANKSQNEIDVKLARLNRDLDIQGKLYLIKLVESGMLMKGFLSGKDNTTLETISIELGINQPASRPLKPTDPKMLAQARFKALRDGLVGEARRRVEAINTAQGIPSSTFKKEEMKGISGEIILEDFYSPEEVAVRKAVARSQTTGVLNQTDELALREIEPYLEGSKKLPPVTKLPPPRSPNHN